MNKVNRPEFVKVNANCFNILKKIDFPKLKI